MVLDVMSVSCIRAGAMRKYEKRMPIIKTIVEAVARIVFEIAGFTRYRYAVRARSSGM